MAFLLSVAAACSIAALTSCSSAEKPDIEGETLSVKPAAPVENQISKFAQNAQGAFACGLYLQGKKVGYLVGTNKIVKRGDTEFFEQKMETLFSANKRGKQFSDKSTLTRMFNLNANGELTSIEQISERDGGTYTSMLIKQGDKYLETSTGGKTTKSVTVEPPKTSLANDKQLNDWLRSSPKAGDEFEYKSSDFNGGEFNEHTSHYKYVAKKELVLNGVPTTIHSLEQRDDRDDEVTKYDCDNSGRLIRGNFGPVAFRLEEESTARKLDTEGVDLIEASSVPTNVRMGDPRKLKQVLLKLYGIKYTLPNSHRQMQTADGKGSGWTTLMLTRDFKKADKVSLSKEDLQKFLKSTPAIQSDNAEIKSFSAGIVGSETNPIKKAELLQKAIFDLIGKDVNRNSNTALEVLERKAGDCTEHSLLFNALARAAGIPSREVTGLMYTQAPSPQFYWHVWNEIHDGERWISVDPTWNEVFVDAGHLKISDDDTIKIANSFGKIKIEILSFQTSDAIPTKGAFIEPDKARETELVLMDRVPPPPAALHSQLREAPPPVNFAVGPMPAMNSEEALNAAAQPKPKRKDLGKPIQQFHGSQMNQVQFDKEGHLVQ